MRKVKHFIFDSKEKMTHEKVFKKAAENFNICILLTAYFSSHSAYCLISVRFMSKWCRRESEPEG